MTSNSFAIQGMDWSDFSYGYYARPSARDEFKQFLQAVDANTVSLDSIYYIDPTTNTLSPLPGSATTQTLVAAGLDFATSGYLVEYRVYPVFHSGGSYNNPIAFFQSYKDVLVHEAQTAQAMGASILSIGAEMGEITSEFPEQWASVIAAVRSVFSGKITYGAHLLINTAYDVGTTGVYNPSNEAPTLSFGDLLDYIGLNLYSALPSWGPTSPTTATMEAALSAWDRVAQGYSVVDIIRGIGTQYEKPILLVESGFPSRSLTDIDISGPVTPNEANQAVLWTAEMQVLKTYLNDLIIGMSGTEEFPKSEIRDQVYLSSILPSWQAVQGKLAQDVFGSWYSGAALQTDFVVDLTATTRFAFGFDGNDTFRSTGGSHVVDGGSGFDLITYPRESQNYTIHLADDGSVSVLSVSGGATDNDVLRRIEALRFTDKEVLIASSDVSAISSSSQGVLDLNGFPTRMTAAQFGQLDSVVDSSKNGTGSIEFSTPGEILIGGSIGDLTRFAMAFTGFHYHADTFEPPRRGSALVYVVPVQQAATTTLNLLALDAGEQIAASYVAFFGRAADAAGFDFWVGEFNHGQTVQGPATLFANIASSFGVSNEAKALYPFLVNPFGAIDQQISMFLDSVYTNMFNRASDAPGRAYWTGQIKATLAAGQFVGSVLVDIMSGAQDTVAGKDISTLMGKVAVGIDYVHEQQQHHAAWAGASDTTAATNLLHAVTSDPQSVLVGIKNAEMLIASHA